MLFDIEKIVSALLPQDKIRWFSDITEEKRPLPEEIIRRLTECARRWDGYEHPAYGDGWNEFARNRKKAPYSCLIPRRFTEQWGQDHLWHLCVQPTEQTVRLTVSAD